MFIQFQTKNVFFYKFAYSFTELLDFFWINNQSCFNKNFYQVFYFQMLYF